MEQDIRMHGPEGTYVMALDRAIALAEVADQNLGRDRDVVLLFAAASQAWSAVAQAVALGLGRCDPAQTTPSGGEGGAQGSHSGTPS